MVIKNCSFCLADSSNAEVKKVPKLVKQGTWMEGEDIYVCMQHFESDAEVLNQGKRRRLKSDIGFNLQQEDLVIRENDEDNKDKAEYVSDTEGNDAEEGSGAEEGSDAEDNSDAEYASDLGTRVIFVQKYSCWSYGHVPKLLQNSYVFRVLTIFSGEGTF